MKHRFCKRLDHLFTFLDPPAVEATSSLAERQLRPAVIARSFEILAGVAATSTQRRDSFLHLLDRSARLDKSPPKKAG